MDLKNCFRIDHGVFENMRSKIIIYGSVDLVDLSLLYTFIFSDNWAMKYSNDGAYKQMYAYILELPQARKRWTRML